MQHGPPAMAAFRVNVPPWPCANSAGAIRSPIRTEQRASAAFRGSARHPWSASDAVLGPTTSEPDCAGAAIAWRPCATAVEIALLGACREGITGSARPAWVGEGDFQPSSSVRLANAACLSTSVAIAACAAAKPIWSVRRIRASRFQRPTPRASSSSLGTWLAVKRLPGLVKSIRCGRRCGHTDFLCRTVSSRSSTLLPIFPSGSNASQSNEPLRWQPPLTTP